MEKVKVTMYLPADIAKKFKVFCAETERSYGDWVEEWLLGDTCKGKKAENKMYGILAKEHLKWKLIQARPTPHELSLGADKKASSMLSILYDLASEMAGINTNPFRALETSEGCDINPLDIYRPSDLASRRISEEEYVKIIKGN